MQFIKRLCTRWWLDAVYMQWKKEFGKILGVDLFDNLSSKANGWKASSESINSFADSIMDRLNNLIGQTRV